MRDDFELLRAWSEGDEEAGNELVERHFSSVFGFFRSKLDEGVDDMVQRTFLGCLDGQATIRGTSTFRAFLFGVARKQLLRLFKEKRRGGPRLDLDEVSIEQLLPSPSRVVAGLEEERLVAAALRRIPVDLQITVELFYFEELSVAEVADVLGVASGTVKSRLGRARGLIRDEIARAGGSKALEESAVQGLETWAKRVRKNPGTDGGDG